MMSGAGFYRRGNPVSFIADNQNKGIGNIFSPITNILRDLHIHQTGFSKCCIGMVTTNPQLKQNNFKQKLRMLRKINLDETYQIRDTAESIEDNT